MARAAEHGAVPAVAAGIAAAATVEPRVGVVAAGAAVALLVGLRRLAWWAVVALYAAAAVLGYGFANVGIASSPPLPLAQLALAALLPLAAVSLRGRVRPTSVAVLAVGFVAVAAARVAADLPRWGEEATRDATIAIDLGYLVVGYWTLRAVGREQWVRTFRWVFLLCLAAAAVYPWRERIAAASPDVGLRQPVPLLGDYSGLGLAAAAGFYFFVFLRPFGRLSPLLAAAFLPALVLFQSRGLYLAVPAAALLVWAAMRHATRASVPAALAAPLALAAVLVGALFVAAPSGRLSRVSPDATRAQIGTLLGNRGPGDHSYDLRLRWARSALKEVREARDGWLLGVGFGPDLAGGFVGESGIPLRKPHNDYLEVLARLGIPGLALLVGALGFALLTVARGARGARGADERFLLWVLAASLVYLLVAATQPLLSLSYATIPLFTTLGAGLALATGPTQASAQPGPP